MNGALTLNEKPYREKSVRELLDLWSGAKEDAFRVEMADRPSFAAREKREAEATMNLVETEIGRRIAEGDQ